MNAPRFTRIIDRIALVGHPAGEALGEWLLRSASRSMGRVVGRASTLIAPCFPLQRLGEAFDEGLDESRCAPAPRGRVLHFPDRD